MKHKKIISISILTLFVIFTGMFAVYSVYHHKSKDVSNYEECVAAEYPIQESYPEQCSVPNGKTYAHVIAKDTSVSLEGRTECLPSKDATSPHTMKCAMGLKTDQGKYYGLGTDPYDSSLSITDRRVHVNGRFKSNTDSKYDSEGTITVTSYERLD